MDKQVAEAFESFDVSHNPDVLTRLLNTFETNYQGLASASISRMTLLSNWILFFSELDKRIKLDWDQKDVPQTGIIPGTSKGLEYPSGVDPTLITDPEIRVEYEKELRENKEKAKQYIIQLSLKRLDERAMNLIGKVISNYYSDSATDKKEFEKIVGVPQIRDERKVRLHSFIP